MNYEQDAVETFHEKLGATVGLYPEMRDRELRAKLIMEEAVETVAAMGFDVTADIWPNDNTYLPAEQVAHFEKSFVEPDFVEAIDGLCDLLYVVYGAAVAWGIDLGPFFEAVHKANMAKDGGGNRADGKILKPEGWRPPDIEGILIRQERYAEIWREMLHGEEAASHGPIEVIGAADEEAVA